MTVEEYNKYNDRLDWGEWLRSLLLKALEGSGLRPSVEYIPEKWRDATEKELEANPDEPQKLVSQEMYRMTISLPLEWNVVNLLANRDICAERALEIAARVKEFATEAWPDRICSDYQWDMFRKLPGDFEFMTEKTPEILHRITMWKVSEAIGKRNIRNIDLYDDLLVIHTRRGSWRIDYDDYRLRLREVLDLMKPWMRKPIRYRYLYELRRKKNDTKEG